MASYSFKILSDQQLIDMKRTRGIARFDSPDWIRVIYLL
jgi:hypothetical protein